MNKTQIKKVYYILPKSVRKIFGRLHIKERIFLLRKNHREKQIIESLRKKESIEVVFFAMSVSFWKYDSLFQVMLAHKRYKPCILLVPRPDDPIEIQQRHLQEMKCFFENKGYPILCNIGKLQPDIIFYAQPYTQSVSDELETYNFPKSLICYVPYAFFISNYKWAYDSAVHNMAWKLFYPTKLHLQNAQEIAFNKGKNVEITGYPLSDEFQSPPKTDPWKIKSASVKRIIWGVHHAIFENDLASCSTFLKYANFMLDLAAKSPDFQFAFKPHPHLREHLYKHQEWGKEKTDVYYRKWNSLANTFLFEGNYIDLFKTSDALIHDCGSFTVEYLYVNKPILYVGNQRDDILCHFGKLAMKANYTLGDFSINEFLSNVSKGIDPKKKNREIILRENLLPPNGKTSGENIFNILDRALKQ